MVAAVSRPAGPRPVVEPVVELVDTPKPATAGGLRARSGQDRKAANGNSGRVVAVASRPAGPRSAIEPMVEPVVELVETPDAGT